MTEHAAYAAGLLRNCLLSKLVIVTARPAVVAMVSIGHSTTTASVVRLDIRTADCLIMYRLDSTGDARKVKTFAELLRVGS